MIKKEKEIWKTYPDYPFLKVSNLGRVRTVDRVAIRSDGRKQFVKGRILKQQRDKDGYMYVNIRVNGKFIGLRVHRIVATCFIPNPNNYPQVNHIDNNRANNNSSNLEWCTNQYNQDYRNNFGTSPAELFGMPVIAVNTDTFEVFWFESQCEAARQLEVYQQNISAIINGQQNKAHGYSFINADKNVIEKSRSRFGDKVARKIEKLMSNNCN